MARDQPFGRAGFDPTIDEMQRFALGSLRASAAVFYWIDDAMGMQDVTLTGVSEEHFARYQGGMHALDPLNIPRLTTGRKRVVTLHAAQSLVPSTELQTYKGFLYDSEMLYEWPTIAQQAVAHQRLR
jgi:hypothetical protein